MLMLNSLANVMTLYIGDWLGVAEAEKIMSKSLSFGHSGNSRWDRHFPNTNSMK